MREMTRGRRWEGSNASLELQLFKQEGKGGLYGYSEINGKGQAVGEPGMPLHLAGFSLVQEGEKSSCVEECVRAGKG